MPHYKHKTQKTIPYTEAPSGYINIEKWEPPFMPVKKGFGYHGIVAEDSKTGELQCHVCGKWTEMLTSHFSAKHKLTGVQYRKKFGLLTSTALKSKRIRLLQSKLITKLQKEGKMNVGNKGGYGFTKGNKESANRKGIKKADEAKNKYGVCDLQIMTKIIDLSKKLGKTPSLCEIEKEYGRGLITIMHYRYGSYIKYCRNYLKLTPLYSNHNPKPVKEVKKEIIEAGNKVIKEYGKFSIGKMPIKEGRYIYKHFKNVKNFKKYLIK